MFDPTPLHAEEGMNALQIAVHLGDAKIAELILEMAKQNYLQVWAEKLRTFEPLKNKDYINSSKSNGVTTL